MKFSSKQKGTALGMLIGFLSALTVVILGTRLNPFQMNPAADGFEALRIAAISVISVCIFLVFSIGRIARHRFFSPDDIDGAGLTTGTAKVKLLQAELQNTVEQTLLAIIVYFSWAILLPSTWILVIPLAGVSFAIGRILFF
ncbi:MAG: MAPEG family protein [Proteobacteria bacterium]|nr:MAPEG family protein [Pseudomonadota bacterium]